MKGTVTMKNDAALWGNTPKLIYLQLLEKCNLRCKMCYEWGDTGYYFEKKQLAQLDINTIKGLVDQCKDGNPRYWLYGGEPLLYPHIEEAITYIKQNGSTVDMDCNGTLLADKADMLIRSGIDNLFISLDGPREINDYQRGQGVYDRVRHGIETLYNKKQQLNAKTPRISLCTVVTLDNYRYLEDFYLKELDLSIINQISLEMQYFLTPLEYERYRETLKDIYQIDDAPYAKGVVRGLEQFSEFQINDFIPTYNKIKEACAKYGVIFNSYPRNISYDVLKNYYSQEYRLNNKKRCIYPWVFVEITANGDVSPCHAYYDLTFGNINEQSFLDIWRGENYQKFRGYMKHHKWYLCSACCHFYNENKLIEAR